VSLGGRFDQLDSSVLCWRSCIEWRGRSSGVNLRRESVAFSRNGAQETRIFGIVLKGLACFSDGGINAVVSIDEYVFAPDVPKDFFASDETMAIFGEQEKQLQRDALQFDEMAVPAKLKGAGVELEAFEVDCFGEHDRS
jgi:hypothetical protein